MNKFWDLVKNTYRGKSLGRVLLGWHIYENCRGLGGVILDLAGGGGNRYGKYWQIDDGSEVITVDFNEKANIKADIEKPLPFSDNYADVVFLFCALYIAKSPVSVLKEIKRVLKPSGKLFLYTPFVFNEAKEPNDYYRFTKQGLEYILKQANFNSFEIEKVGERFSASLGLVEKICIFKTIKLFARMGALLLDKIYPKRLKQQHPCPVGYFVKTYMR